MRRTEGHGIVRKDRKMISPAAAAAGLSALCLLVLLSLRYRFWFDLNDDVLMKDILSGVYTGTPESRNIQMLYPVSALIAVLYRIIAFIPKTLYTLNRGGVYGSFLILCQAGSAGIFSYCLTEQAFADAGRNGEKPDKALLLLGILSPFIASSVSLRSLIVLQYTMTAGWLMLAAAALVYTRRSKAALVVLGLSFAVRTEMTLLLSPFILLIAFSGYFNEYTDENTGTDAGKRERFTRGFLKAAGGALRFMVLAAAVFLVLKCTDLAALSGRSWRSFTHLFDERTRLYDYYLSELPEYDDDPAFYDGIGVTREQAVLLNNYNFGLDEGIDDALMQKAADRAQEVYEESYSVSGEMKRALLEYRYRITHFTDGAPAVLTAVLYLFVIVLGQKQQLLNVFLLFACRSSLWLFMIFRRRVPERVTGGLFLLETGALLLLLMSVMRKRSKRYLLYVLLTALLCFALLYRQDGAVMNELSEREEVNTANRAYRDYLNDHPDIFLFTDVYSTVAYSEKVYEMGYSDNIPANHDIMGGWACKSPLYEKKLAAFGFSSMEQALLDDENCFYAAACHADNSWLTGYYAAKGIPISLMEYDKIEEAFTIYRIVREDP
ncbi:MAG: hypothetical protein IJ930_08355 [Lachnospiraceae bacterium]|nr:hypothetical protein [Lachnospiraceae bacterium]